MSRGESSIGKYKAHGIATGGLVWLTLRAHKHDEQLWIGRYEFSFCLHIAAATSERQAEVLAFSGSGYRSAGLEDGKINHEEETYVERLRRLLASGAGSEV